MMFVELYLINNNNNNYIEVVFMLSGEKLKTSRKKIN
jgi:hypothetical protein